MYIYKGYYILQEGEVISAHSLVMDEYGIYIVHDNITHVLFLNDADEVLKCTKEAWVNRSFKESRTIVKIVDINSILQGIW